jgi:hypothetical protein
MGKLVEDLKYAVRLHTKAVWFTIVALGTLSLGIGASTAVFSVLNSVLLQRSPIQTRRGLSSHGGWRRRTRI